MKFRFGRIILAALATEVLAILTLVLIVAVAGPGDREADQVFAQQVGFWVGPIAGFVFCLLGGYAVARVAKFRQTQHGFLVGLFAAALDVSLLLASSPVFSAMFVVSNVGRVIAGTLGGWVASRTSASV